MSEFSTGNRGEIAGLLLEQFHAEIRTIQIVLRYSQVSSCHLVVAVVVDMHDDYRRDLLTRPKRGIPQVFLRLWQEILPSTPTATTALRG